MIAHSSKSQKISTFFLIFSALFFACISHSYNKELKAAPQWQMKHHEDGSTRFEFNHENQNHHFEFKVIGYRIDGQMKRFDAPTINQTPGQTTKTWSKNLTEHWIQNGNEHRLTLYLKKPPAFKDKLKLVYEIDTSEHGDLNIGGPPIYNNFSNPNTQATSLKVNVFIDSGSNFNYKDIWNLNAGMYFLDISKKANKPIVFDGLFRTRVMNYDVPQTRVDIYNIDNTGDSIQIAEIHNVRFNNKPQDHIHVTEVKNNGTTSHELNFIEARDSCINHNTYFDSASINNDWALVSSSNYCGTYNALGSLLAFHKKNDQWRFHSKILDPKITGKVDEFFDIDNLILNDSLFVASGQGVYVYQLIDHQWHFKQYIEPPSKKSFSNFRVEDDWLALGFTDYSEDETSQGEVRMYKKKGQQWEYHITLKPSVGHGTDRFGESLSLSNNYLAVTAPDLKPESKNQAQGVIHLFKYTLGRWRMDQVIRTPASPLDNSEIREFRSHLAQLSGQELYVYDHVIGYKTESFKNLPNEPEFADGLGGIHHYKKQGRQWQFVKTIKPNHRFAQINQHMTTHEGDLYYITTDSDVYDQPAKRLHHYQSNGKTSSVLIPPTTQSVTKETEH